MKFLDWFDNKHNFILRRTTAKTECSLTSLFNGQLTFSSAGLTTSLSLFCGSQTNVRVDCFPHVYWKKKTRKNKTKQNKEGLLQFCSSAKHWLFEEWWGLRLLRGSLSVIQCEKSQENECSLKEGFYWNGKMMQVFPRPIHTGTSDTPGWILLLLAFRLI